MSYSPQTHALALAHPLPRQDDWSEVAMPSIPYDGKTAPRGGPALVLIGEKLRTVALARRLERAGIRVLRVPTARLPFLRAETVCGLLIPSRELDGALVEAFAARAELDPAWQEVPLIIAGPCPELNWPAAAKFGPHLLPDLVDSPMSMASLRRILDLRQRVLADQEAARRRGDAEEGFRRRLEQEALLRREAEHRNKNILQMACGILMLEMAEEQGMRSGSLARAADRIRNLACIQDLLRRAADERVVRLDELLTKLGALIGGPGAARLHVDADVVETDPDKAVSVGLIAAEALMNALKYATPAEGVPTIRVSLKLLRNGTAVVEVADDGPGIHAGAPVRRRSGGIQIMTMLAERLGGALQIDSPGGTRVSLSFPVRGG